MARRATRAVDAGGVGIGSDFPVSIQTMTNVPLADAGRTLAQIERCAALSCDLLRVAVDDERAEKNLPEVIRNSPVPVLFTAGNHDWHYEGLPGSDRVLRQEWTAKRLMPLYRGRDPLCYAYSLRGMEVVMMDNSVYEILPGQLDFMRAILTKGKPVLLGCHIPLYLPGAKRDAANYGCGHPGWGGASDPCWQIERRERWHEEGPCPETFAFHREVFEAPNLLGIAAGHTHVFRADTFRDKFQLTVSMHRPCALELGPLPTE